MVAERDERVQGTLTRIRGFSTGARAGRAAPFDVSSDPNARSSTSQSQPYGTNETRRGSWVGHRQVNAGMGE